MGSLRSRFPDPLIVGSGHVPRSSSVITGHFCSLLLNWLNVEDTEEVLEDVNIIRRKSQIPNHQRKPVVKTYLDCDVSEEHACCMHSQWCDLPSLRAAPVVSLARDIFLFDLRSKISHLRKNFLFSNTLLCQ